jgi:hypothetical protein
MRLIDLIFPAQRRTRAEFLAAQRPVVLMGRGHSGTRVLSWICTHLGVNLGTREDLVTGDVSDTRFQDEIVAVALQCLGATRPEEVKPRVMDRFGRAAFRYYTDLGRPSGLWGWKFPETYLIGPCVAAAFPRARFIHLVRDGRDLAFKQHLTDNPNRKLGRAILGANGALGEPHHLQAAVSWAFQVDRFDAFSAGLPRDRVFTITFNELCMRPADAADAVCRFLGIRMTAACRRYLEEEIDTGKLDQFRESDGGQVREVEARVGPTLRRHGFMA